MLIRNAEIHGHGPGDLRVAQGVIAEIGTLAPLPGETVIDAAGGALLPGLHDHHVHLAGLAVRDASAPCGPPEVCDAAQLAQILARPGEGWLRGIGYHESVMGLPDARALDVLCPHRPLRIQHRSGRMWLLNSLALEELLANSPPPAGLEREDGRYTGRLFDEDGWLRGALQATPPPLAEVSARLARFGVTGVTDMTPQNDAAMAAHFAGQIASGALAQRLVLAGTPELAEAKPAGWTMGPAKLHLHESAMPGFDDALALVRDAHGQGRGVAVHCTTELELVFTLALFEDAGTIAGDRIEHAGITDPGHIARMADLALGVCLQPHFIAERGDRYLADVDPRDHAHLYRLASLHRAGLALAGGSDAPFASADPWEAMRAAVTRQTQSGALITPEEALSPEQALALWLADPHDLSRQRQLVPGAAADFCLLDSPWNAARERLGSDLVRLTIAGGRVIHDRIQQAPGQRLSGRNPPA